MPFEDVMTAIGRWMVGTEALAALSAELTLAQRQEPGDPDVTRAIRAVSAAADLSGIDQLAPPQRDMAIGLIRMILRQSQDLLDDPGRGPGWTFTDPDIVQGWGRGSMVVPATLAASVPELADIGSFLDIGAGIGLLAIAAARTWPQASVTGIEIWEPALRMAADNIRAAGLEKRVTVRE